jgi:hypothetical protein
MWFRSRAADLASAATAPRTAALGTISHDAPPCGSLRAAAALDKAPFVTPPRIGLTPRLTRGNAEGVTVALNRSLDYLALLS